MYKERYEELKNLDERMLRQLDFIMEVDKLKRIVRQSYISGGSRKETDTDHSWSLAMMVFLLSEYANEEIDVLKTMKMVLIHDIVEIDAGDTYAYDEAAAATQREREEKAADRIFGLLPKDQEKELRAIWEEFEKRESKEAKFARTLDNLQPVMLNDITEGKAWVEHEIYKKQVLKRNEKTHEGSEKLWEFEKNLIDANAKKGKLRVENRNED